MIKKCAWCNEVLEEIEPIEDERITHGICKPCREKVEKEIDDYTVPESVALVATTRMGLMRW